MESNHGQQIVVEWAPFSLASGVSEARLLEASMQLQDEFLSKQRGFVRRELLRGKSGHWVDVVYWADRACADAAIREAMNSPTCALYFGLMAGADHAEPGAGVVHFDYVASYEANASRR